jgi:hypothetical protein
MVDEILHDPKDTITTGYKPRYGHYMDIRASRGPGIRYTTSSQASSSGSSNHDHTLAHVHRWE